MTGLEAERLNVAARGLGIARAAFEEAIRYAQRRVTFGKAIAEYQTIQNKLADMATKIEASRLLIYSAAENGIAGSAAIWKRVWPSCSLRKPPRKFRLKRCGFWALTGTRKIFRWSGTIAMLRWW